MPEAWRGRLRTSEALVALLLAHAMIAWLPLAWWKPRLGQAGTRFPDGPEQARRIARHVDRAAQRLPVASKCLPRAMALSRMLGRRRIAHRLVIAARPARQRHAGDALHAWIAIDGVIVLGDVPGPWVEVYAIP